MIGTDLASQAKTTALCAIEWTRDRARAVAMLRSIDQSGRLLNDERIVAALRGI